ncbi:MAG: ATP-binding protein [Sandaracinus sp.]|nr:ATP-binding protein [Sandaracinus sp.]
MGAGTIADRLARARRRRFVGRRTEQELFRRALDGELEPALLWLVGPGGIGKTALLLRLSDLAEEHGRRTLHVDARHLLGTPESFLEALGRQVGNDPYAAFAEPSVLFVDTAEDLGGVETWLRDELLPRLPSHTLVVVAGREPPVAAWRRDPAWAELLRVVALRNLAPDEARAYLEARSLDPSSVETITNATFGHPLALSLLADVADQRHDDATPLTVDSPDILTALVERFRVDAPSDLHRRALEVAAHARLTDVELLRHAVDGASADELYDWLAQLSFAVVGSDGLYLHDLAAHALDTELRRRDPSSYLAMHRKVREPCVEALRSTTGVAQLRAASDVSWLHRFSPVMGRIIDWSAARMLAPDRLREGDADDVIEATRRFQGNAAADAIARWIQLRPESFTIVREAGRGARGYVAVLIVGLDDEAAFADDPRVAAAFAHARAHGPLRGHERLCVETWLDYRTHVEPGALASQLSIKDIRTWLGGEPLAWSFLALPGLLEVYEPLMGYLMHERAVDVSVGATTYTLFGHDWRVIGPREFLDRMAEREVLGAEDELPPPPPRPVVLARDDFARALKDALRVATDPDALARNPLSRSRVSLELPDEAPPSRLRGALERALETLASSGKDERAHAAVKLTYLDPARTQEEAAELLGLSFSTYRRHLAAGVERITEWLWQRELHGYDAR